MLGLLAQVTPAAEAVSSAGSAEFWVFWIMAPIALGAAIAMVLSRNAVHAALLLVINFFAIAVLYAVLEAQFLATVQIIVYAGAIMVLFLFVIMLLGVDKDLPFVDRVRGQKLAAIVLGVVLLASLLIGVAGPFLGADAACNGPDGSHPACSGLAQVNEGEGGNVRAVGLELFTRYVWPFEVTSVLLVIAAVGAVVIGRRREDEADLSEAATRAAAPGPVRSRSERIGALDPAGVGQATAVAPAVPASPPDVGTPPETTGAPDSSDPAEENR